jgi:hypothetical protein
VLLDACSLTHIEYEAERIPQIAAWNRRIFLYEDATCGQKVALGSLHIVNEKVEYWSMRLALLDEQTNGSRLDAQHGFCFIGDLEAKDSLIEHPRSGPIGSSQDYVAR